MSALPNQIDLDERISSPTSSRLRRFLRGPVDQPAWIRPALLAVLILAALLDIISLNQSGFANTYYSAAVLAATRSWKAFFFGSVDAGNFITIDKPAGALWLMDLSARIFGVSSWSILLPEALAGIASVGLLFVVVRRSFGAIAGLIAALVLAVTPVAVLMFRYNNPDGIMTLLLIAAAWAFLRGIDTTRTRWFLLAAFFMGLAFNTKYLQAYLVVPALVLTFLIAARGSWRKRLGQLAASTGVLVVSSGWWLAIMTLLPASARPYIGGSTDNSVLNLVFGYDGFGRILGAIGQPNSRFGGGFGGGFGGTSGLFRMFNPIVGGQISWLLPFALIALVFGLVVRLVPSRLRGLPSPWWGGLGKGMERPLSGYAFWGSWLVVAALVFSFSAGIFHAYYTIQIAPAIAALVGAGVVEMWAWRSRAWIASLCLAAAIMITAWWSVQVLQRTPNFVPWLAPAVFALAAASAIVIIVAIPTRQGGSGWRLPRTMALGALSLGLIAILAGPTAYSIATVGRAYSGGDPSAGPVAASTGGPGAGGQRFNPGSNFRPRAGGFGPGQFPPLPAGDGQGAPTGPGAGQVSSALIDYLEAHKGNATWIVAVNGANQAASIELASGEPVMAMGGFSGSDPSPTLQQLQTLVHEGKLKYILIGGGGFGGPGGTNSTGQSISAWVQANGTQVNYGGGSGGMTLYELS